jgi:hypothetical protein
VRLRARAEPHGAALGCGGEPRQRLASCGVVWITYISLLNQYKDEQGV